MHPFLDKIYFQIAKKSMYVLQLEQAHHFLGLLVSSRELQYGQESESLIKPFETMIHCLRLMQNHQDSLVMIETCLDLISRALGEPRVKEEEETGVTELDGEPEETIVPCPLKHPNKILIVS